MLHHSHCDLPALLKQSLIVPVRVDVRQLLCDQVMFPHPLSVRDRQRYLLIHARVSGAEAVLVLFHGGRSVASVVGVGARWQQLSAVAQCLHGQPTVAMVTERVRLLVAGAVDV